MKCQGCLEELTTENRRMFRDRRLSNYHTNELCDKCLEYFVIKAQLSGKMKDYEER